jgi:hypothetical protein
MVTQCLYKTNNIGIVTEELTIFIDHRIIRTTTELFVTMSGRPKIRPRL